MDKVRDYHNFCTIDTPKGVRAQFHVGDIYINEATCKLCGDKIRSRNRHDFVRCTCGAIAVDGGSWYIKRTGNPSDMTDNIVMFNDVD